jgi:glycosyltransferase involved in cell wall biosynthesis
MKILIAVPYYFPRVGGLENYAKALAEGLAASGHRVVVVCGDHVRQATREKQGRVTVYRLPIWFKVSNTPVNPLWFFMLRRIIRTEQPDLINGHTPVPSMVDMAALAAGQVPLVVTYHAATLRKPGNPLMTLATEAYLLTQRLTLRRARSIFAVSEFVKLSLPERVRNKTFVMPNATYPVDVARSRQDGLVFVNNLERSHRWKGLDLLLEALAAAKTAGDKHRLIVVGDGTDRARYEAKSRALGLDELVRFQGKLVGADRDAQMRRALALVHYPTTANDAFPTILLEAWALGVPVITAAIGPMPSLVEDGRTGLLVAPNNAQELARVITAALNDPAKLRAMGRRGRRLVESEYNWDTQVARAGRLLKELA